MRVSKTVDTHSNTHMFAFKFLQHSDNSLSLEYVSFFLIQKQMMGSRDLWYFSSEAITLSHLQPVHCYSLGIIFISPPSLRSWTRHLPINNRIFSRPSQS